MFFAENTTLSKVFWFMYRHSAPSSDDALEESTCMFKSHRILKWGLLVSAICLITYSTAQAQGPYNLDEYEKITGKKIEKFNEAPMLKMKVEKGDLPPVEKRLPENPLVMEPWEEVGKYGGTVLYFETNSSYDFYLYYMNE